MTLARAASTDAHPDAALSAHAAALAAAERILAHAKSGVRTKQAAQASADAGQHALHGLAWLATYVEALRQMLGWARGLAAARRFGELERLLLDVAFAEYLAQIAGGIPMSQGETVRLHQMGVPATETTAFAGAVAGLVETGASDANKARIAALIAAQPEATTFGDSGMDETHAAMREEMRRFSLEQVIPHAHGWHLRNEYIPLDVIAQMSAMGVFGLTIPESYGGMGLGKEAMCVVSEELSRGYIGVGSLGTRSEIAGELILHNGTDDQKKTYLARIASGAIMPTAVFTEPNTGSDLASLKTRAERHGDCLQGLWPENVDHASRPRRHDDAAGAHQPEGGRL